jgi:hypothetical protein
MKTCKKQYMKEMFLIAASNDILKKIKCNNLKLIFKEEFKSMMSKFRPFTVFIELLQTQG